MGGEKSSLGENKMRALGAWRSLIRNETILLQENRELWRSRILVLELDLGLWGAWTRLKR